MSQKPYSIPFEYPPEDMKRIRMQFEKAGKPECCDLLTKKLEISASYYLSFYEWNKALPDRKTLEKLHQEQLASLTSVRDILMRKCGPSIHARPSLKYGLDAEVVSDIVRLFKKFERGEIPGVLLLDAIGVRALDFNIEVFNQGSPELEFAKDGKKEGKRHRRAFIRDIASCWAWMHDKPLSACSVSTADGATMLGFVNAYLEPVTGLLDKELIQLDQIENIVREIIKEPVE